LLESRSGDEAFVALAHPFEGKVIAIGVQWVRRRESVETGFCETPQIRVSFEVEGGVFVVSVRPSLGPPSNAETAGIVVGNDVGEAGVRELHGGVRRRVCYDLEFRSRGQIVVLVETKGFPVVGGIATTVER
jgi:hypothetical protein